MADEISFGLASTELAALRYERTDAYDKLDPIESDWLICSMIPQGGRVLDVGCGSGVLMSMLRQAQEVEIVGVEPNAARASAARARQLDVRTGYLTPDLLNDLGTFDAIVLADVLEHLEDPGALLIMVRSALRPGGRVVASIPNVAHWSVRAALMLGRFDYAPMGIMDATHLRWFTEKGARALFEGAGFEVRSMSHSAGYWMPQYRTLPSTILPGRVRRAAVKYATRLLPTVFGCQHVFYATPAGA